MLDRLAHADCVGNIPTSEADSLAMILSHVGGAQMDDLGNPRASIVEQLKEQTVPATSPTGRTRSLQDRLDLRLRARRIPTRPRSVDDTGCRAESVPPPGPAR